MLALTFELLNATLGTLIGQIKSGVEQADKAQKTSLALGQSLGGLSKQITVSDKLQTKFNKAAKDSAARTQGALKDVRTGTEQLSRSLEITTTKLGTQYRIAGDTFKETVNNLNKGFEDLVQKGIVDRGKPIREMATDQLRGDFTQRLGTIVEGLTAGIELDEIDGSIGKLINEQMLLGGDVKGTAKSLAFLNTTMRMDTKQRGTLVETLRDTRDKFTVSIDTLVESVDAIKQFIPLFKSAGMDSAVGGLVKAAGQLGPEMQQQFKDFAQLMFDPSFEAMQKRSILGVQGFTKAIQGMDEAGVQKTFMDAARQSSRVVDTLAGDLGTMLEGFSVPVNALGNVAYSIKALGEMDPRKMQKQLERANFADQITVLFDELFAPVDSVVFTELYGSIVNFMKSMNAVLIPKVQEFANKISLALKDPEAITKTFLKIYNSMATIANLFISLASTLLANISPIIDFATTFIGKTIDKKLGGSSWLQTINPMSKGTTLSGKMNAEYLKNNEQHQADIKRLEKLREITTQATLEALPRKENLHTKPITLADGRVTTLGSLIKEQTALRKKVTQMEENPTERISEPLRLLSQTLKPLQLPHITFEQIQNTLADIKDNTEEPPDFAEPTMIMTESVKSLGDALLAITLSNYDEERDIALASLKAQVDIANKINQDISPGPAATLMGGAK
tara:strand:- start:26728 stop:28764 length:2037 start_codon:yes stop_codon:yes gene_type:complete